MRNQKPEGKTIVTFYKLTASECGMTKKLNNINKKHSKETIEELEKPLEEASNHCEKSSDENEQESDTKTNPEEQYMSDDAEAVRLYKAGLQNKEHGNAKKAHEYFEKAAERHMPEAEFECGLYFASIQYRKSEFEYYLRAAQHGYLTAQFNVARLYYGAEKNLWFISVLFDEYIRMLFGFSTRNSVPDDERYFEAETDYAEGEKWGRMAAEGGYVPAQNWLGDNYYHGNGVKQDYTEAVKWYKLAAEQGNAESQKALGDCYYHGRGVKQDYAEAAKWYKLAAENGSFTAKMNIKLLNLGKFIK